MDISSVDLKNVEEWLDEYDVDVPSLVERGEPETESLSWQEYTDHVASNLRDDVPWVSDNAVSLADNKKGTSGTPYWDGKLKIDDAAEYSPFELRGRHGDPGTLHQQYKNEPVIMSSVNSIKNIQVAAERRVTPPKRDNIPSEIEDEMFDWVDDLNLIFNNLKGSLPGENGFNEYLEDAAESVALFSFAPFQVTWTETDIDGLDFKPKEISYHETHILEKWVMDSTQNRLLGAEFNPTKTDADVNNFFLSSIGEELDDHKLVLARMNARGNNWEGVPSLRPAQHWIKFKKLLGQIAAGTAQKYGVPTTFIYLHEALLKNGELSDIGDIGEVVDSLNRGEALDQIIAGLPDGLRADIQDPSGTMPDFQDLIRYCDEMIAKSFSNEGSLLGASDLGSYALAEVKDNEFIRSAPMYNRVIMGPINALIKLMTKNKFGDLLPAYPTMSWKMRMPENTSEWVDDLDRLFDPNTSITTYPEKVREETADKMGLPKDTFDPENVRERAKIKQQIKGEKMEEESLADQFEEYDSSHAKKKLKELKGSW